MPMGQVRPQRAAAVDDGDGHIVPMVEPGTAASEAHDPRGGLWALREVDRRRRQHGRPKLDRADPDDAAGTVVGHHRS